MQKTNNLPRWMQWAREIQALAQTGNHYALNEYQSQRYQRLSEIAAEIIAEAADLDMEDVATDFKAQTGYATPRIDVRGAVFRQNKLLLVRERADGGWTMPGGWADVGDVPSQAAEREVWEEAGFRVKVRKVVGIYDANRFGPLQLYHSYKLIFLCDILSGEASSSIETSEASFFGKDELPTTFSGQRTNMRHVLDAFRANEEADSQTVFD